ncbi:MAG TPA: DNA repair protein RecN [Verrucomicrobiae bacterium]|jgi:DNA repair protein RecN (Recombination protein N)|nr:DNA repair protein RecN [Verrucomicrobiae bacterium]
MLRNLLIENYGLIERAEMTFASGATIFTGETGSGKTMLLGALGLALGDRASVDAVRRGAARAQVTLTLEADASLRARLDADGYPFDAGEEAVIVREVGEGGKSSIRVNGRPATAGYVREIGVRIADAVGQHEAQRLLAPAYHVELLDRFGGQASIAALSEVRAGYAALMEISARLDALEGDDRTARRRYEDAQYEVEEIVGVAPIPGEDEPLTDRRRYLDNVERIAGALRGAHDALAGDDVGASETLGAAGVALHGIAAISKELDEMARAASGLQSETNELATRIARELEATEFDANELETINARLEALDRLKRKYGGSLDAVLARLESARTAVRDFDDRDERTIELRAAREVAHLELGSAAATLSALRQKSAKTLCGRVAGELGELALAAARFDAAFETLPDVGPDGAERVEFTFAANAGEPLRPLARVASGGELSRVLLAIFVALAERLDRSALIFDEIDTGVGGVTATAVGLRLGRLADRGQVVCVTHLAQIAIWAQRHYVLEKRESKSTTTIAVVELTTVAQREIELARMLSGQTHEVALKHARTLLASVKR